MNNSLIDHPFISAWARQLEKDLVFIYNGTSMAPLFKPGDVLFARKLTLKEVHLGDVVIIAGQKDDKRSKTIVHRVVRVKPGYVITQGDNRLKPDLQIITNDNLVGRVILFSRQNHTHLIKNGYAGWFYACSVHGQNLIRLLVRQFGWKIYHQIRQSGLIAKLWFPKLGRICVMSDKGIMVKYYYGKRTVARWWPEQKRFDVEKPFDLVICHPKYLDKYS